MSKKIHVCTTCGSPRVTWDAIIDPNNNNEIVTILDNADCQDCDGECNTQTVEAADDFDMEKDFYDLSGAKVEA